MITAAVSREPVARTLAIAVLVALVCSAMVSLAIYWLRPLQAAHQLVERNRALVVVAGLVQSGAPDDAVTEAFFRLDARVWDRQTGEFTGLLDGRTYDHWAQTDAAAQADQRARYVPVYLVAGQATRLVVPVHGKGMWSTIYGYVGLAADFNTVTGVTFHRHGETPGIGDRIQDAQWLESWHGKRVFDAGGVVRIAVSSDAKVAEIHRVDLISGASVTAGKVGELVGEWMGADGYGPLLKRFMNDG
jgi:Na+-transporting NADH:ubiquinone oxidoreductase subunit C